jgi:tetratricopeptide (TPR) repeat protein
VLEPIWKKHFTTAPNEQVCNVLGVLYGKLGEMKQSEEDFQQAITYLKFTPLNHEAKQSLRVTLVKLADMQSKKQQYQAAIDTYQELMNVTGSTSAMQKLECAMFHMRISDLFLKMQQADNAKESAQHALLQIEALESMPVNDMVTRHISQLRPQIMQRLQA